MSCIKENIVVVVPHEGHQSRGTLVAKRRKTSHGSRPSRVQLDPLRLRTVLAERRLQLGWSLRELAERSGVSSSAVHALEQGNTRAQLDNFVAVLAALELTPDQVLVVDAMAPTLERSELEKKMAQIRELRDPAEILRRVSELLALPQ